MRKPRCGVPDHPSISRRGRNKRFALTGQKWRDKQISYRYCTNIVRFPPFPCSLPKVFLCSWCLAKKAVCYYICQHSHFLKSSKQKGERRQNLCLCLNQILFLILLKWFIQHTLIWTSGYILFERKNKSTFAVARSHGARCLKRIAHTLGAGLFDSVQTVAHILSRRFNTFRRR